MVCLLYIIIIGKYLSIIYINTRARAPKDRYSHTRHVASIELLFKKVSQLNNLLERNVEVCPPPVSLKKNNSGCKNFFIRDSRDSIAIPFCSSTFCSGQVRCHTRRRARGDKVQTFSFDRVKKSTSSLAVQERIFNRWFNFERLINGPHRA